MTYFQVWRISRIKVFNQLFFSFHSKTNFQHCSELTQKDGRGRRLQTLWSLCDNSTWKKNCKLPSNWSFCKRLEHSLIQCQVKIARKQTGKSPNTFVAHRRFISSALVYLPPLCCVTLHYQSHQNKNWRILSISHLLNDIKCCDRFSSCKTAAHEVYLNGHISLITFWFLLEPYEKKSVLNSFSLIFKLSKIYHGVKSPMVNASVNSTCAQAPPGLLREICTPCQSRVWGICKFYTARGPGIRQPRGHSRGFDTHAVSYQNVTTQKVLLEKKADWLIYQGQE